MYKNIVKGEYCPREKSHICIGDSCEDYGNPGCEIYFRSTIPVKRWILPSSNKEATE